MMYSIPVTWQSCGNVYIRADSKEKALKIAKENMDSLKLPENGEYIDGSFDLISDDDETMLLSMTELSDDQIDKIYYEALSDILYKLT